MLFRLFRNPAIWDFEIVGVDCTLKRIEKIIRQNAFDKKKKKPGLKSNPRLALIGLRATWALGAGQKG